MTDSDDASAVERNKKEMSTLDKDAEILAQDAEIERLKKLIENGKAYTREIEGIRANQMEIIASLTSRAERAEAELNKHKELIPRLAKAQNEADKYRLALESLTPGGSEFVGDSIACVAHVQQRRKEQWALISELRQSLASAEANTTGRNKALEEARQIALEDLDPKCRAHGCEVCETRKSIADRISTLIEQAGEQR